MKLAFLIKLSENDKRILIALGILLILVFVIIGYIGLLVERVMKHQAKRAGVMLNDVVAAKVITTEHDFKKFARKKNNRVLAEQALIPMAILFFASIIYLIYGAVTSHWNLNIFDYQKEGFGTITFLWDFKNIPTSPFFGGEIISGWPPILNEPHWENAAWASYIIVPSLFVGGTWLLVATQAHIARTFRIRQLAKNIFNPTLDNINVNNPDNNVNNNTTPSK